MKGFISPGLHPFYKFLVLLVFMAGGICVGMFVALLGLVLFYGVSISDMANITQNPQAYENGRGAMIFYQLATHFFMFTAAPLLFLSMTENSVKRYLFKKENLGFLILLSGALAVLIIPANSWLINWNATAQLPEVLKGFEVWAKEKEEVLAELTKFLTQFHTVGQLLMGLVAFALVPAIGEELVFRGILQRNFLRWFKNPHVAIWVTAIIFGAIHVQFFGFVPRTVLGAIFGYLYYWSGNFWVPVAAHFVNNGFTVLLLYLQQNKLIQTNVESTEALPWHWGAISLAISVALLFYLKQRFAAAPENVKAAEETV